MINDSHPPHISLLQMNGIWILICKTYAEHLIGLPMAQKYYNFKTELIQGFLPGYFTFINLWYSGNRVYIDILAIRIDYIMTNQCFVENLLKHSCF